MDLLSRNLCFVSNKKNDGDKNFQKQYSLEVVSTVYSMENVVVAAEDGGRIGKRRHRTTLMDRTTHEGSDTTDLNTLLPSLTHVLGLCWVRTFHLVVV